MIAIDNLKIWGLGIGDWDWGLGIGDWDQYPIPNTQSPIPKKKRTFILLNKINYNIKLIIFQKI